VSVTLPAAGYDYNSDWTLLLAGLSPAGMTASLAARSPRLTNSSRYALSAFSDLKATFVRRSPRLIRIKAMISD
jgi:hypothetical protein